MIVVETPKKNRRPALWIASAVLALVVVLAILIVMPGSPFRPDPLRDVRASATKAVKALNNGNLDEVGVQLAINRGDPDFAYFFTSKTTPRSLGDALASVSDGGTSAALMTEEEGLPYELVLTDLAGATSLATRGTGMRELPDSWTDDFVLATTTPEDLYPDTDKDDAERVQRDGANKQNLLLLLSRGHWSVDFLKSATSAYWNLDVEQGREAWPGVEFDESLYAPAPSGVYLTDGMVALTAALTANAEASKWAFDEFQPGTSVIEGSDYEVGDFTYHLVFEHEYPEGEEGRDIGMAATLTALAAATETDSPGDTKTEDSPSTSRAAQDSETLTAFAQDVKAVDEGSCTWLIYDCIVMAAKAIAQLAQWVWERVGHWGHFALDILSMTTFAPPPFMFIGVGAAASNASWYAIEGDYLMAGISLATAVPGLAFTKLAEIGGATKAGAVVIGAVAAAKGSKVGNAFKVAADRADKVAGQAKIWANGTKETAKEAAERGARTITTATKGGFVNEKAFENWVAKMIPGSTTQKTLKTNCKGAICSVRRDVDIYHEKTGACIEVKIAHRNLDHSLLEVKKDVELLKNKTCKSVSWVFGPDKDGVVGPSKKLREALQQAGIPYDIVKAAG